MIFDDFSETQSKHQIIFRFLAVKPNEIYLVPSDLKRCFKIRKNLCLQKSRQNEMSFALCSLKVNKVSREFLLDFM